MYTFILQIYQHDVDMFAAQSSLPFPSISITISAEPGPNTVTTLIYPISLKGIEPDNMKLFITRLISNTNNGM